MVSNIQYWHDISSFDSDDLFFSPVDVIPQYDCDQYSSVYNDRMEDEIFSSPETNQEQLQILSIHNPAPESPPLNLKCGVCGAPATGYNFNQITCESCKAFFRRNALRDISHLKCRLSGSCVINLQTRRLCTYCRLKKCFDIEMRKDWIRTEEEKEMRQLQKLAKEQRRLNKLTNNQQALLHLPIVARKKKRLTTKSTSEDLVFNPMFTKTFFGLHRRLSDEDQVVLNNLTNAYQLGADKADCSHIDKYAPLTPFSQFINDESKMHESLIWFFKSVADFKQLDLEDQVLLIKSNLLNIVHLHHIIIQNFEDNPKIGEYMSQWINGDFHNQMSRTRRYFYRFMKYPLVLKLVLIILIFSINLSIPHSINQYDEYKNPKRLYECQNHYTTILWRYLNHLFEEKEAINAMEIIIMQILRYQKLMITMENRVRQEPNHHILHSLMQSIFGLN